MTTNKRNNPEKIKNEIISNKDKQSLKYTIEELEEMTNGELKEILQIMKIKYDDDNFIRKDAIISILEHLNNNN